MERNYSEYDIRQAIDTHTIKKDEKKQEKATVDFSEREYEWRQIAIQAYRFKQLAKRYHEMAQQHMKKLKELSGQKTAQYGNYILECVPRKGVVDYSLIPELKGMDLEPYRKPEVLQWKLWKLEASSR